MTAFYETQTDILVSNNILDAKNYLKNAFNKIKEKFIELKSKKESYKYKKEAKIIINLTDEISDSLEENPLFKDKEFYDFLRIKDILEYLLRDRNLIIQHHDLIENLLGNFRKIILEKLDFKLNNKSLNTYKINYAKFKTLLDEKEEYFLVEIYPANHEDDTLVERITKIIEC